MVHGGSLETSPVLSATSVATISCLEGVKEVIRVGPALALVTGVFRHWSQASGLKLASLNPIGAPRR